MSNKDFQNGFIAGLASSPNNIQRDWAENSETSPAYIKNRTHYKEDIDLGYLIMPYIEPIPALGLGAYGKKIGLQIGRTYDIEIEIDGHTGHTSATATELPESVFGVKVPGVVYLYNKDIGLQLLDGIDGDVTKGEIYVANNCYYTFDEVLHSIKIYGVSNVVTVIHKLPSEYYDVPIVDKDFNPESENAQSGIAVAQALSGGSGISAIVEEINAGNLDYGIYYIDCNNGGCVNVPDDNYYVDGTIFVSPSADLGGKQVSILGIKPDLQTPIIVSYVYDEDGNYMDIYDEFVSKTYVDASVRGLQKQIDELK